MLYISTANTTTLDMNTMQDAAFESASTTSASLSTQDVGASTTLNATGNPVPNTAAESQQITVFADDSAVTKASVLSTRTDPHDLLYTMVEDTPNEITDFLSRPQPVLRSTWDPADPQVALTPSTYGYTAYTWNLEFPKALFEVGDYVEKLRRYAYFRADVCMRIMVNGSPMQQGKLWCWFAPFTHEIDQSRIFLPQHLAGITGFPGGELDVSVGNTVELRIPYVSPYPFINMIYGIGSIGDLHISIINPVTIQPVDLVVYAWFENVRLHGPTAASLGIAAEAQRTNLLERLRELELHQEVIAQGAVSDISGAVASVSNSLSNIPMLGEVARPLGWMASLVHHVSSALGFSKPSEVTRPAVIVNVPAAGFTNCDMPDNSVALSTTKCPGVGSSKGLFGTDVDEMDITYMVKKSCLLTQFLWDSSQTRDTELSTISVAPTASSTKTFTVGTETKTMWYPTTLAFVASMFQYWRGGIKYRISVAKTAFHTGRMRVVFIPQGFPGVTYANSHNSYQWILDLRTGSELEFTIPYLYYTPWRKVKFEKFLQVNSATATGLLKFYIINELRAPDTVSPTVGVNVWVSGTDDTEFGVPIMSRYAPAGIPDAPPPPAVIAQVLGDDTAALTHDEQGSPDEGRVFSSVSNRLPAQTCLGELITNLRPLTRRFGWYMELAGNTLWKFTPHAFRSIPRLGAVDDGTYDPCEYISTIYRFYRGGVRFKINSPHLDVLTSAAVVDTTEDSINPPVQASTNNNPACAPLHLVYSVVNNMTEFEVPQMSNTPAYLIGAVTAASEKPVVTVRCSLSSGNVAYYRATADDATFGWLVGAPTLAEL